MIHFPAEPRTEIKVIVAALVFNFGENLNCELIVNHQWAQSNISIVLRAIDLCNVRHVLGENHGATCLCPYTITGVM